MLKLIWNIIYYILFGPKDAWWILSGSYKSGSSICIEIPKIIYGKKPPSYASQYYVQETKVIGPFNKESDAQKYADTINDGVAKKKEI